MKVSGAKRVSNDYENNTTVQGEIKLCASVAGNKHELKKALI